MRSLPESTSAPYAYLSYSAGLMLGSGCERGRAGARWVPGSDAAVDKVVTVSSDGGEELEVEADEEID